MMPWASMIARTLAQWIRVDLVKELLTLAHREQFAWLLSLAFQSLQKRQRKKNGKNKQKEKKIKFKCQCEMVYIIDSI